MAISACNTTTNKKHKELLSHGTQLFPIACYHDKFSIENVPWHWHDEFELILVIQGKCQIAIDSEKFELRQGEGIFINSGILHTAWDHSQSDCQFHSIVFHPRLIGGCLDSVYYQNYVQPLMNNNDLKYILFNNEHPFQSDILKTIEFVWQLCAREDDGFEFLVRNQLSTLFFQLIHKVPQTKIKTSSRNTINAKRIKLMLNYIHERYSEPLTIGTIAKNAQISESECLRCFRNTIGTTPIHYLKQYRLEKSADYLLTTNLKIQEIGFLCGFQEMSYFAKSFKEINQMTPSEFKKYHQQDSD